MSNRKNIQIKLFKWKQTETCAYLGRTAGISKGGFFLFPILSFGYGANGFIIHLMGFYLSVSWIKV